MRRRAAAGGGQIAPWILYFADASAAPAAARTVSVWIWPSASVDQLVHGHYVQGNLSLVSEGAVSSPRQMREVVGVASWSDSGVSGRCRARHLFIQADPERVVDVVVFGPRTPSAESEPTAEMRSIQETVVAFLVSRPSPESASCPRSRGVDASGMITSNRTIGIFRGTYESVTDVEGAFLMVRRGSTIGQRVGVVFPTARLRRPGGVGVVQRRRRAVADAACWVGRLGLQARCEAHRLCEQLLAPVRRRGGQRHLAVRRSLTAAGRPPLFTARRGER